MRNFARITPPGAPLRPEATLLAIGSAREVPVVSNWRLKATISVDHHISDGAEAAQFMQALPQERRDDVAKSLEEPIRMLV